MTCRHCAQWNPAQTVRCAFCGNPLDAAEDTTADGSILGTRPLDLSRVPRARDMRGDGPSMLHVLSRSARELRTTERGERPWLGPLLIGLGALMVLIGMVARCR